MNLMGIGFLLLMFILAALFIIGAIVLMMGLSKKDKRNPTRKMGLILMGIPLGIAAIAFLYDSCHDTFTAKPTNKDLVGIYHITGASGLIAKSQYHLYKLEFRPDGTFYLSHTPNIDICETGKYVVDWQFELNEISFQCDNAGFTPAHIDRSFSGYRIEFIIGDPDSGESIFFTKDK